MNRLKKFASFFVVVRQSVYRPYKYPCWIIYEKTTWLLFGIFKIKSKLKKIK